MIHKFAPSDVTFANCDRCYYLNKKFGIKYEKPFPGVFSTLDVSQKKYFINKTKNHATTTIPFKLVKHRCN